MTATHASAMRMELLLAIPAGALQCLHHVTHDAANNRQRVLRITLRRQIHLNVTDDIYMDRLNVRVGIGFDIMQMCARSLHGLASSIIC